MERDPMKPQYPDPAFPFGDLMLPTEPGERVLLSCYGGNVRLWMCGLEATVVRFTNRGNPVLQLPYSHNVGAAVQVVDTVECGKVIRPDGRYVRIRGQR